MVLLLLAPLAAAGGVVPLVAAVWRVVDGAAGGGGGTGREMVGGSSLAVSRSWRRVRATLACVACVWQQESKVTA